MTSQRLARWMQLRAPVRVDRHDGRPAPARRSRWAHVAAFVAGVVLLSPAFAVEALCRLGIIQGDTLPLPQGGGTPSRAEAAVWIAETESWPTEARPQGSFGIALILLEDSSLGRRRPLRSPERAYFQTASEVARCWTLRHEPHRPMLVWHLRNFALARHIATTWTADELVRTFANEVYFGRGANGIEAAARLYFDRPSGQLRIDEVAVLAGLVQAPSASDPWRAPQRALKRRDFVLQRLHTAGLIDEAQLREALGRTLSVGPEPTGKAAEIDR